MFAVISWNTKNGVALEREELEVKSSSKYIVMNGGKQEAEAVVSKLFRKDMWRLHPVKINIVYIMYGN